MEASTAPSSCCPSPKFEPDTGAIERRLLKKGVHPTPKIIHTLRKKEIQKHNRKLNKIAQTEQPPPLTESQKQAQVEESHFQKLQLEYKAFSKASKPKTPTESRGLLVGMPWERIERLNFREIASESKEFLGEKLKREHLSDLKEIFIDNLRWVLDNDIEVEDENWISGENQQEWDPSKRRHSEKDAIRFLVDKLSSKNVTVKDWKLAKMMKLSGLLFTERQLLKIVEGLGEERKWEQALAVVEWVYNDKERRDCKSRFVYTKLLSVLGKARRPQEALHVFNLMREDWNTYPDLASYHSIAVTLGQAGLLQDLLKVINCMQQKPYLRNNRRLNWDPVLEPDLVIYNSILNACVPLRQWKGVSWVFQQLRQSGLKPNGATYGLAMEVMLHSGKYDLVHQFFGKMNRSREVPKALTYKVLVRTFCEEGKVNEAAQVVREMEKRGVVGAAGVYYELACCLCNHGRWTDAMVVVEKMKKLHLSKPLEDTFTGMIMSSLDGGHVEDCISIFEHMKAHCIPNIGTINTMLKVYSKNDMFSKAKGLFEEIKGANGGAPALVPDEYTYSLMLGASASALQWEYFEHVYREMAFSGYQLDRSKHAPLLVEASRAGKGHLLEHAFDAILETGEIPHSLFFTEMVLQATAQQNYERAIILVDTMALAPFQVSERQWKHLFEKNRDRISRDSLDKLLDALGNCDITSEVTVLNLSRSLQSLCASSGDISRSLAPGIEDADNSYLDDNNEKPSGDMSALVPSNSAIAIAGSPEQDEDPARKTHVTSDTFTGNHRSTNQEGDEDTDVVSSSQKYVGNPDRTASLCSDMDNFVDDGVTGVVTDCSDKLSNFILDEPSKDNEVELKIPVSKADDSNASKLPSAYEILDVWKESRNRDGVFSPFQLGHK